VFRLNDYMIKVRNPHGGDDRRKVVEQELCVLLSGNAYIGKSDKELAILIEREIQIRMPDSILWYQLTCLTHAGRFPKDGYLTINVASQWGSGTSGGYTRILSLGENFRSCLNRLKLFHH